MSKKNLLEYLEILQLEYFSYLFRSKIYELPHYIKMAQDIAKLKEEKIKSIGFRSGENNIFTNKDIYYCFYKNMFLNDKGLPNFKYPLEKEIAMKYWDKVYTFKKDSEVLYGEEKGVISMNFPSKDQCLVDFSGDMLCLNYDCLTINVEL